MPAAFMKASANNTLPANARQIMYAARPKIAQLADRGLGSGFDKYFTQQLLPDFIAQTRPAGHRTWCSTRAGTSRSRTPRTEIGSAPWRCATISPASASTRCSNPLRRLGGALPDARSGEPLRRDPVLGKEGFPRSSRRCSSPSATTSPSCRTKGMSVTASRELVEDLCATTASRCWCCTISTSAGFTIFGTLRSSTRRYTYRRKFRVIDLGLRLADIDGPRARGRLRLVARAKRRPRCAGTARPAGGRLPSRRPARRAQRARLGRTGRLDRAQAGQARHRQGDPRRRDARRRLPAHAQAGGHPGEDRRAGRGTRRGRGEGPGWAAAADREGDEGRPGAALGCGATRDRHGRRDNTGNDAINKKRRGPRSSPAATAAIVPPPARADFPP